MARSRHLVVSWSLIVVLVVAAAAAFVVLVMDRGHNSNSGPPPRIVGCDNKATDAQVQPLSVTLTCADAGIVLDNVKWRSWRDNGAAGVGAVEVNDCNPDCADGTTTGYPVDVTAGSPKTVAAVPYFRSLHLNFPGSVPQGFHNDEVFSLPLP